MQAMAVQTNNNRDSALPHAAATLLLAPSHLIRGGRYGVLLGWVQGNKLVVSRNQVTIRDLVLIR